MESQKEEENILYTDNYSVISMELLLGFTIDVNTQCSVENSSENAGFTTKE